MTTETEPSSGATVRLRRLWRWFSKVADRFAWLVLASSVVAFALLLLGVFDDWKVMVFLSILLMTGFVKLIADLAQSQEAVREELTLAAADAERLVAGIGSIDTKLAALLDSRQSRLLTNGDVFRDLSAELGRLSGVDQVTVRLLSLGLGRAKNYIRQAIQHPLAQSRLHFEILVLSDALSKSDPRPPMRLCQWSAHSNDAIEVIADTIRSPAARQSRVSLELRRYGEWPFIHGIAIVDPVQVVYCSLCRWVDGQYDSALSTYRKIKDAPQGSVQRDDAEVFLSFFDHLWASSAGTRLVLGAES